MQRTLNRELKELEIAGREATATCEERRSGRGLSHGGLTTFPVWDSMVAGLEEGGRDLSLFQPGAALPQLGRPSRYQLGFLDTMPAWVGIAATDVP